MAFTVKLDSRILDELIAIAGQDVPGWIISDGVEYGVFQEFGTSKFGGRPFLVPAFEEKTKTLPDAVGQAIERQVSLEDVIAKTAFDILAEAQSNIQTKKIIDTGALLNSMNARPE